jgi:pseudouridine kinase
MDSFSIASDSPVLVIGSAGVDIVGKVCGKLLKATSNPAYIRNAFGGVARNVAENLARLGQPVRLLAAVGIDQVGQQLLNQVVSAGVDISAVHRTDQWPTGSYLAVLNSIGELEFALDDMRIISAITPDLINQHADLFFDSSLLFLDANLSKETLRTIFSYARKANIPVCVDPTSSLLAGKFKPYLPKIHMIVPNQMEAEILCERKLDPEQRESAIEAAKCLVNMGVEIAIITLAQLGLVYATSETSGHISAVKTEIIDPTGAGDALSAAVIFAMLNEIHLDDAVRLGVSAASIALSNVGAVDQNLSLEKLYNQLVI